MHCCRPPPRLSLSWISFDNTASSCYLAWKSPSSPWILCPTFYVPRPSIWANSKLTSYHLTSCYRFLSNDFKSFHLLFKVLFIFPSQYLFAIGLPPIFSFRRSLSPILGCNPKQPDSLKSLSRSDFRYVRGFHPLCLALPDDCTKSSLLRNSPAYNSNFLDFHCELLPVHSPLLRQSLLVSFPPLTDMLKFSGWSCLISGADRILVISHISQEWPLCHIPI